MKFKEEQNSFYRPIIKRDKETLERDILNSEEAASFLRVCVPSLLTACKNGQVPHCRIGRKFIFSKTALSKLASCEK